MATSSELTKGLEEVEAFRLFISRSRVPIDPLSVEKRNPPEPDLLCRHATEGLVAFELANLCDPAIAKVIAAGPKARTDAFSTSDPSAEIVRKKLKKSYTTRYPIELLMYSNGRLITPDDVIIPTITPILESRKGPYRRAWFMGRKPHASSGKPANHPIHTDAACGAGFLARVIGTRSASWRRVRLRTLLAQKP